MNIFVSTLYLTFHNEKYAGSRHTLAGLSLAFSRSSYQLKKSHQCQLPELSKKNPDYSLIGILTKYELGYLETENLPDFTSKPSLSRIVYM